jgi:ABC-type amino acid transport substrate-binding protein
MVCMMHAASATTLLRTAAPESNAPKFVATGPDEDAAIGGLCVDILRAIERVEPDIRFSGDQRWMPMARIEAELAGGVQDVAPCLVRNPEREARFAFLEPPLFPVGFSLAVRADDEVQIKNWDDVRKLGSNGTVLAVKGSGIIARTQMLAAGIRFDADAATPELNLRKLLAGRGRFFYHATPILRHEIRRANLQDKVKLLTPPMDVTAAYLALGWHVPPETADKLRRALLRLQSSGELMRLQRKWEMQ